MRTGPLLATAMMLTVLLPVATAEDGESEVPILVGLNDSGGFSQSPTEFDDDVTPEDWQAFLTSVDHHIEENYPNSERIGHRAALLVEVMLQELNVQGANSSLIAEVIQLLPVHQCDPLDTKCMYDLVWAIIGAYFEPDGLQPPVGVNLPTAQRLAFGLKVAAVGPENSGGRVAIVPGHLYIIMNG